MPASSTSTLSLAGRLRDLGDDDLVALLALREVRDVRVRDFFDLADALLDSVSVQRALGGLERGTLAAIAALGTDEAGLTLKQLAAVVGSTDLLEANLATAFRLALIDHVDDRWLPYRPVTDQLASWPSMGLPDLSALVSTDPPAILVPVSPTDAGFIDKIASEKAFNAVNAIAALVAELQREPARELARGGIALPETKRLATAMSLDLEDVPTIVDVAARANLAILDAGQWTATDRATEWMLGQSGARWAHVAAGWFARLPDDIRELLRDRAGASWGEHLADYLAWRYPAGGAWMRDRTLAHASEAEMLGITARQIPSTPGMKLLTDGETAASAAMARLFPAEIDKVYLQHDLSIVAPGPVIPELDARLRLIADVETRALATTYRVSEATINRALTAGETADGIRSFLSGISLSGLPQPLDYLITGAAARFGSLRVGRLTEPSTDQFGAQSYVTAEDASQLSAIMVDHGLIPLGLTRVGPHRALSRFDEDIVFWSLSEARYPVAAEDAQGRIVQLRRRVVTRAPIAEQESPAQAIVRRLRLAGEPTSDENGKAWLERQLDTAIKAKLGLTVTVAMPDGSTVDLQLEPASVAGGRLRARDRRSDLERTLPLSSITAVGPAEL